MAKLVIVLAFLAMVALSQATPVPQGLPVVGAVPNVAGGLLGGLTAGAGLNVGVAAKADAAAQGGGLLGLGR